MGRLNILPENPEKEDQRGRFPSWLHRSLPKGGTLFQTEHEVKNERLHTVCEEAKCPNRFECWSEGTATFLILGKVCTRSCGFCSIATSRSPPLPDDDEPFRIGRSIKTMKLKHAVITMVARDDLPDGGASHLKRVIEEIRRQSPSSSVEVLTSDFKGDDKSLEIVLTAGPEIFNHNVETVKRLTPRVRHVATYEKSLELLKKVSNHSRKTLVKSGLMVGLGEKEEEVLETLSDLKKAGVQIVTIGQYLQPTRNHLIVKSFVPPETFAYYAEEGKKIGLSYVFSGPLVRSSYNAGSVFNHVNQKV